MESNRLHIERALDMVMRHGRKRIGVLGLSFKAGTDDLRHSPMVEVTERLIGKGYDVRIYDRNVSLSRLIGANREYILEPHPAHRPADGGLRRTRSSNFAEDPDRRQQRRGIRGDAASACRLISTSSTSCA